MATPPTTTTAATDTATRQAVLAVSCRFQQGGQKKTSALRRPTASGWRVSPYGVPHRTHAFGMSGR